eukprot:3507231-Pleurochrysis_carterae.AAC.1
MRCGPQPHRIQPPRETRSGSVGGTSRWGFRVHTCRIGIPAVVRTSRSCGEAAPVQSRRRSHALTSARFRRACMLLLAGGARRLCRSRLTGQTSCASSAPSARTPSPRPTPPTPPTTSLGRHTTKRSLRTPIPSTAVIGPCLLFLFLVSHSAKGYVASRPCQSIEALSNELSSSLFVVRDYRFACFVNLRGLADHLRSLAQESALPLLVKAQLRWRESQGRLRASHPLSRGRSVDLLPRS